MRRDQIETGLVWLAGMVMVGVFAFLLLVLAAPWAGAGGNHDACDRKPWKPECQTTTTVPPETTTTTVATTTTTEAPPTTLPPPDTPTIVVVDVSYRQECPSPEHPAGLLEVTVTGTAGTVVDVMGQTVTVPGSVSFDLPAQGFVWTVYVDWDGGSRTLTDEAPVCASPEPAPEVQVYPPAGRERLPVTGFNVWRAVLGVWVVAAGAVFLWVVKTCDDNEED